MLAFFSVPDRIREDNGLRAIEKTVANRRQWELGEVHFIAAIGESFERNPAPLVVLLLSQILSKNRNNTVVELSKLFTKVRSAVSPAIPNSYHLKTCLVSRYSASETCFASR